ncbi:MAG TPA: DUF3788 domain-containing protein [Smithella sp.]|nr:DUF3788 domain-containing protein [Smithella sp.]
MNSPTVRMTKPGTPPNDSEVRQWLGQEADRYWKQVTGLIHHVYPDVFTPEWLFGGKKHGWSLRYKKSKSFCTLIPEKNRFALLIVFGTEERAKVETIKKDLSRYTRKAYDEATTYHDGKWLLLTINDEKVVEDVKKLLAIKRKPKINIT